MEDLLVIGVILNIYNQLVRQYDAEEIFRVINGYDVRAAGLI